MLLADEEVEYNDHFDLYMTRMEYLDFPRSIYSRVCFINWNDSHYDTNERRQNIEEAIRFKERAKKEKQLIELENLLLESLSSSEVCSSNLVGLFFSLSLLRRVQCYFNLDLKLCFLITLPHFIFLSPTFSFFLYPP